MRRNVVPANNFQILFTTRHLTSWAEGLARYEIRWEDSNAVLMVGTFTPPQRIRNQIIVQCRHWATRRAGSIATSWYPMSNERNLTGFQINFSMKNGRCLRKRQEEFFTVPIDRKNMDSFQ